MRSWAGMFAVSRRRTWAVAEAVTAERSGRKSFFVVRFGLVSRGSSQLACAVKAKGPGFRPRASSAPMVLEDARFWGVRYPCVLRRNKTRFSELRINADASIQKSGSPPRLGLT